MAKSMFVQSELCIGVSGAVAAAAAAAVLLACPGPTGRFVDTSLPSELRSRELSGEEEETKTCEKNRDEDRIRVDGAGRWKYQPYQRRWRASQQNETE